MRVFLWYLLLVTCYLIPFTAQADQAPLPSNRLLLDASPDALHLTGDAAAQAQAAIIPATGPNIGNSFDHAWRIAVHQAPAAEYQIQLASAPIKNLHPGDRILLSLYARVTTSDAPAGDGCIGLVLEQAADPYDKIFNRRFTLSHDWQQLSVAGTLTPQVARTGAHLALRVGYFRQTLEIAGVQLRAFDSSIPLHDLPQTPITYEGRSPDAQWRKDALARIDKIRKAPLEIHVVDSAGKPVAGAHIDIHMTRQSFAFGCVYNDSRFPANPTPADLAYQQHYLELFNTGVDEAEMKWPAWIDPAKRAAALSTLQWMLDHHIEVRGHNLVWPGWKRLPPNLKSLADDPQKLEQAIEDHITDEVTALRGKVIEWDVINEPYLNNDLMHILGNGVMADWFKTAHAADPGARLYLNETNVPNSPPWDRRYGVLYDQIQTLQHEGAPIGGIGMQAHFADDLIAPQQLLEIFSRYRSLHLPIRITELDIDVPDEQVQADYFRDFLIASYSDEQINGILLWGFWESQHWQPSAALFRKDWTIKPNGQVWKDLVLNRWRTNTAGVTANNGDDSVKAFLGTYQITVQSGSHSAQTEATVGPAGATLTIMLH